MSGQKSRVSVPGFAWAMGAASLLLAGFWGCSSTPTASGQTPRGSEWVESSHGDVSPDAGRAFPDTVRNATLVFSAADWNRILTGMATVCGSLGANSATCTGSRLDSTWVDTTWFDATLLTDGQEWIHVGVKLQSNSDLSNAWKKAGSLKLPFHLTLDKLEDSWPAIRNQRFYGFKKLALDNLYSDSSFVRHHVASEIDRAFGVPAPLDQLVKLKIVTGSDTLAVDGLYSLREVPASPLLARWFSSSTGDLYHPSSDFVAYAKADFKDDGIASYADVKDFVRNILHSASRTATPASWRAAMEAAFDVSGFLRWLAVGAAAADTKAYGWETGSSYLYDDGGRLRWVAGDLDASFDPGAMTGARKSSVWFPGATDTTWPLIADLLADPVYCREYKADLTALVSDTGLLAPARLVSRMNAAFSLAGSNASTTALLDWAANRKDQIDTSLANHACP